MTAPRDTTTPDRGLPLRSGLLFLLLALFAAAWFGTLDYRRLVNPDEGRYAEIPREMVATGDWLTPRLNALKYFEKPPLQYWATATAYRLFGEHEWTARLWSALCGFLGVLVAGWTTRRLWGGDAALHAMCVLGGSLLWVMIGHVNTLDMGVSFFLSGAIFCFVLAQRDAASPRENRNGMLLGWLMLALAILSKGLIGLVLPFATLCAYSLWQRDFAIWRRLHLLPGLALLLAVTAPWFIAVSLANPEFAHFFFIHEHFERFLTKAHGRYQPMWYFVPILIAGMLPWLIGMFAMVGNAVRHEPGKRFQPQRFLLLWCLVVFGFFSVSDSKLPSYILPLFPALAALIGRHLAELARRNPAALRWHALPALAVALTGAVLAPQIASLGGDKTPAVLYANYIPWLIAACAALGAGSVAAFIFAHHARPRASVLSLACGGMFCAQLLLIGHDVFAPVYSAAAAVERIRADVRPDVPFFSVYTYDQSLQFYLKRTTTMVYYKDELELGIAQEPQKFLREGEDFIKAWTAAPEAWALIEPGVYRGLVAQNVPMRIVFEDARRIIVRKP